MQFWGFMTVATTKGTKTLQYQRALALGEVPRYTAGLQVRLKSGVRVYLALSALELAFYFEEDLALHYDREGRLTKVACRTEGFRPVYVASRKVGASNAMHYQPKTPMPWSKQPTKKLPRSGRN